MFAVVGLLECFVLVVWVLVFKLFGWYIWVLFSCIVGFILLTLGDFGFECVWFCLFTCLFVRVFVCDFCGLLLEFVGLRVLGVMLCYFLDYGIFA